MDDTPAPDTAVKRILSEIESGSGYDALQSASSLVNRYTARGKDVAALRAVTSFGAAFRIAKKHDLAAEMCSLALTILSEYERPFKGAVAKQLIEFCGPESSGGLQSSESKKKLMQTCQQFVNAIDFGDVCDADCAEVKMCRDALKSACLREYLEQKQMGLAQALAIDIGDAELLADVALKWRSQVYPSEKHLTTLRLILILLSRNMVQEAETVLDSPQLGINFEAPTLPPPLQLAYLLTVACRTHNIAFLNFLGNQKYALVVRRDKCFDKLLKAIKQNVFKLQAERKLLLPQRPDLHKIIYVAANPMMDMLKNMMGGGGLLGMVGNGGGA